MPNNNPIPTPAAKPITEIPSSSNPMTENIRNDAGTLPKVPEEILDQNIQEATGKHLTREEQVEFIKNLPPDLMVEFAKRVQDTIAEQAAAASQEEQKPEWVTDFSTVQERAVFDLRVPIQAIDHQIPEYLRIKLKDANFEARWIQTSAKRLGEARAQGWQYVTREDLSERLGIEIIADESGHFVYIDTVAMKMHKNKLFTQLRSNYQRAVMLTQKSKLHEKMKQVIETEIQRATDPETGLPLRESFIKYRDDNKMNVYSPLGN